MTYNDKWLLNLQKSSLLTQQINKHR